jgi:hypothetical protein
MSDDGRGAKAGGSSSGGALGTVPVFVAVVALIGFSVLLYKMWGLAAGNVADPQWSRAAYLFGSVEAIAFAAAGFLFGKEVNRQRAEKAESRANEAQKEATGAQTVAAEVVSKARSLRELAELKASGQSQKAARYGSLGAQAATATQTATQNDLEEVAELAKRLFP